MSTPPKPSPTPKPAPGNGDGSSESPWDRLAAVMSRLPQAIAAQIAGTQARPGLAADGLTSTNTAADGPGRPDQSASIFSAFRSMIPSMARYFDRSDRVAPSTSGGNGSGGGVAGGTTFKPTSADFGKIDWADVLSKHATVIGGFRPGGAMGPGLTSFPGQRPGDVSVDMADVRADRAAARAAKLAAGLPLSALEKMQAGGFGSGAYSAAFNTKIGAGPTPGGLPSFTPPQPARPSWFGRQWNNAWANIGSASASARHAWRHKGHFARQGAAGAWNAAKRFGRWIEPTTVVPKIKAAFGRGARHAGAWAASRAMNAGASIRNKAYATAGHFQASGFAQGVDALGDMAMRASKALGPLGLAAGLAKRSLDTAMRFAEDRNASNERYAAYNPHISQGFTQLAMGDMGRNIQIAKANQDSIVNLTKSVDRMRSSWMDVESATVAVGNRIGMVGAEAGGLVGRIVGNGVRPWAKLLESIDPGGVGTEAAASMEAKIGRGLWNATAYEAANWGTLGLLSAAGGAAEGFAKGGVRGAFQGAWKKWRLRDPITAFNEGFAADEKEQEEQRKVDGKIGEEWIRSLGQLATANVGPFMPHRVVAPPRAQQRRRP